MFILLFRSSKLVQNIVDVQTNRPKESLSTPTHDDLWDALKWRPKFRRARKLNSPPVASLVRTNALPFSPGKGAFHR